MRKIYLLTFLVLGGIRIFAQITTLSDAELGFGIETAIPLKNLTKTQKTGIGGSVKFAYTLPGTYYLAPSFQAGLLSFSGKQMPGDETNLLKENYPSLFVAPVKLGLRYTFMDGLYAEPQAGSSFVFSEDEWGDLKMAAGFTYAINIGYQTLPGLDISGRYEALHFSATNAVFVGLRLAYHFTFRRQEIY